MKMFEALNSVSISGSELFNPTLGPKYSEIHSEISEKPKRAEIGTPKWFLSETVSRRDLKFGARTPEQFCVLVISSEPS